jgi:hypothetical protein
MAARDICWLCKNTVHHPYIVSLFVHVNYQGIGNRERVTVKKFLPITHYQLPITHYQSFKI